MNASSEPTSRLDRITDLYFKGLISLPTYESVVEETRAELRARIAEHRPHLWGRKRAVGSLAYKSMDAAIKADGQGFDLYASVFNNIDRQGEIIEPGAFKNLGDFARDGVILTEHNMRSLPVGLIDTAVQDAKGLRVKGRFHSTPEAQACRAVVRERMAAGKSVKCSIGYQVLDYVMDNIGGKTVCRIKAVNVFEASIVNLPANPLAGVVSA